MCGEGTHGALHAVRAVRPRARRTPDLRRPRVSRGPHRASGHQSSRVRPATLPHACARTTARRHGHRRRVPCGGPGSIRHRSAMTWLTDSTVRHLQRVATWPDFSGTRYTVIEELGRGGMGTVYRAVDEPLQREVAIKVMNTAAAHAPLAARLQAEARVLAALEHPGIVPIHDVGTLADGRAFYVMKRVSGRTLDQLDLAAMSLSDRLGLFERILHPVAFAHARGIIHRDLKPQNIMVGSYGEVLVLDWGVAKLSTANAEDPGDARTDGPADVVPGATERGTVIGTPGFMAPEQARAAGIDARADVYALGVILHVILTGREPVFDERADRRRRLAAFRNGSRRLRAISVKAMAHEPRDRYSDAKELADDLTRYRAGGAVMAYPEGPLDRLERFVTLYRTPIVLIVVYLVMRTLVALWFAP
ncbi:MAG: protein kinase [Luteitalea sp.]|nr:protein kinase [Luteitalea sp.]